jgi:glyoxylase-like metal-dependent hydrolase (beta-lactamase superfamily II)
MHIHPVRVRETTCYLLSGDEGAILIDAGPPGGAQTLIEGASAAGVQPGDVRLIFITHGHLDHYGAAAEVRAWCGAPVAAHSLAPGFSQDRRNALPPAQTLRGSILRWIYLLLSPLAEVAALEADLLLAGGADLSPYGLEARTIHLPGHSPDSLGVLTGTQDAFVGDLFVNFTVPSKPLYLSDGDAWQQSYQRLRTLQPQTVYVGHGDPFPGRQLQDIYPARYQLRWWVR